MDKGIYYLIIKLHQTYTINIGYLGTFRFAAGFYTYIGSAQNNLKHRIERHLRREKRFHWHIDYLLAYGKVIYVHTYALEKDRECMLSREIGTIKNATVPVKGFGSSDCTCTSHLYFFRNNPNSKISTFMAGKMAVTQNKAPLPKNQESTQRKRL